MFLRDKDSWLHYIQKIHTFWTLLFLVKIKAKHVQLMLKVFKKGNLRLLLIIKAYIPSILNIIKKKNPGLLVKIKMYTLMMKIFKKTVNYLSYLNCKNITQLINNNNKFKIIKIINS